MATTKIDWCDCVWNPVIGCSKVSAGCANCYAEQMAGRLAAMNKREYQDVVHSPDLAYGPKCTWNGECRLIESRLAEPLKWKKPRRIFVNSMGDLFHGGVHDEWIERVFAVMALCPQHTFLVLTKRPERMASIIESVEFAIGAEEAAQVVHPLVEQSKWDDGPNDSKRTLELLRQFEVGLDALSMTPKTPLPNVWVGVSIEDQRSADDRIPWLLQTPAAKRLVSIEPMLGPVDLEPWLAFHDHNGEPYAPRNEINWVICGGESGRHARPMHPDWVRSVRDQCEAAGVPFFFKQWGEWWPAGKNITENKRMVIFSGEAMYLVGKRAAGHLLDGVEHREMPQ